MYLCGPGKHNCQPFCGPEGRFYCSDSVCSLWPAPFSYLCVSVMILGVLKTVCGWTSKNWLLPYACWGLHFIDSAACVLSFDHSAPLHIYHHQSPGRERRNRKERAAIFIERTREGHRQSYKRWNCFEGIILGETSERKGGTHNYGLFPSASVPSNTKLNLEIKSVTRFAYFTGFQ